MYWKGDELRNGRKLCKVKASYAQLCSDLKNDSNYSALYSQVAQQTIKSVAESVSSYNVLVDLFFKGEVDRPSVPKYRKSGGMYSITYPSQAIKYDCEYAVLPVAQSVKNDLYFEPKVEIPDYIDFDSIREVRIRPSRGDFWVDWIIDDGKKEIRSNPDLSYSQFLAIDHGVKFWLSCITTKGKSLIIEAPQLKTSLFQYQDKVAKYKKGKSDKYWDEYLDELTSKRNLQVKDAVNKAARFIINRCLKDRIGNLVIGWNETNKQSIKI